MKSFSIITNNKIKKFNKIIKVDGDKSISHRFFLIASQAIGISEAKGILEDILKDHEGFDPKGELLPRVYFSDFSASSLDFKCMYWYHPPAYWDYMEFSERVNLEILERFNNAGIEFAFPTQTVHFAKEGDSKS